MSGTAGELHAGVIADDSGEALWVMHPVRPALVRGSAQNDNVFDAVRLAADDVELTGRRSGGGAVFIDPQATAWIDVWAPQNSRLWSTDPARTFLAVGELWKSALAELDIDAAMVRTAPTREPSSSLICWAGKGWGELTIGTRKVVGLSQRRTRWGARIQGLAVFDDSSTRAVDYVTDAALAEAGLTRGQLITACGMTTSLSRHDPHPASPQSPFPDRLSIIEAFAAAWFASR